jgi:hypothetical protein
VRIAPVFALTLAAWAAPAFAVPDGEPPRVELPLGPYVRPGRPLDVRVIGGADRLRAAGTPWALPQGERGDEFILQTTAATVGLLSLEIERGGRVEQASVPVETLKADGVVVGIPTGATSASCGVVVPSGARVLSLDRAGLPTVDEGWLLLDVVAEQLAPKTASERLARLAALPPAVRPFAEPLLLTPDPRPFIVAAEAAARGPGLPGDVAAALGLLALTEVVLVGILGLRRDRPWRRSAWIAAPALAAFAFVVTGDRLPGALRVDAMLLGSGRTADLVLIRIEARRAGSASFELPAAASSAAVLRHSADDATVSSVSAGRRVDVDLPAGQSRLFAFTISSEVAPTGRPGAPPPSLANWLTGLGLVPDVEGGYGFTPGPLPRGHGARVVAGYRATSRVFGLRR